MGNGLIKKVMNFISGKCKYAGDCALYDKKGVTCNKSRGRYYTDLSLGLKLKPFDFPGCYRNKEDAQGEREIVDNYF